MHRSTEVRYLQPVRPHGLPSGSAQVQRQLFAKSTLGGWREKVAEMAQPLVERLRPDAFAQPYLCARGLELGLR
jgi:hypothetical protein